MSKNQQFESFSIIIKEEKVRTLNHSIIPNTFAIEIVAPLPGYYGTEYLISVEKPGHILFITRDFIRFEDFFRMIKKIKAYLNFKFDASFASVELHNLKFNAIRIRDVDSFEKISELQKAFVAEGVQMAKPRKVNDLALIRIKKFLMLTGIEEGIYSDRVTDGYNYLVINHPFTWKMFEKVTYRIRNNFPELKFDVALGVLFRTGELEDVIRIYGEDIKNEDLILLRQQFSNALKEYI
jgi:hypothetical protein